MRSVLVSLTLLWALTAAAPLACFSPWVWRGLHRVPSGADAGCDEQATCPWRAPADQAMRARDPGHYNPPCGSLHTLFDYAFLLGLSVGFKKMLQGVCVYRKLFLQNVEFCMR